MVYVLVYDNDVAFIIHIGHLIGLYGVDMPNIKITKATMNKISPAIA